MIADREADIRKRAEEIWEREGRPEGRDIAHWEQAKAEIEKEVLASVGGEGESIPLGLGVKDVPKKKEVMKKKAPPAAAPARSARR
jgi:hypothetical protein